MDILRPVEGDADQEVVRTEEFRPLAGDQRCVGLKGIMDMFAVGIFLLEGHSLPVEIKTRQQGFAAVPVKEDVTYVVGGDIFLYEVFQHLLGHTRFLAAVYFRLIEVVAVVALQVAKRAHRLYHNVESLRARNLYGILKGKSVLQNCH